MDCWRAEKTFRDAAQARWCTATNGLSVTSNGHGAAKTRGTNPKPYCFYRFCDATQTRVVHSRTSTDPYCVDWLGVHSYPHPLLYTTPNFYCSNAYVLCATQLNSDGQAKLIHSSTCHYISDVIESYHHQHTKAYHRAISSCS